MSRDAEKVIVRFDRRHPGCSGMSPVTLPNRQRAVMPEFQPVPSAHLSAIERPRCPKCQQNRMLLSKLEVGTSGFDTRTFECQKCGRVETTVVLNDPMTSEMRGWLA